jgi:integrase
MLWIGQGGRPIGPGGPQKLLQRHTRARFGYFVNAHLFRDAVASTITNQDPNHGRFAAQFLGHSTLRTTERNYITADSGPALSQHHDLIAAIRHEHRKRRPSRERTP